MIGKMIATGISELVRFETMNKLLSFWYSFKKVYNLSIHKKSPAKSFCIKLFGI